MTTLFLNKRSRSSSLEHLTGALRDNTTTQKSLFSLWNLLHPANSRIHEVISGYGIINGYRSFMGCSKPGVTSACWFWGFCSAFPPCSPGLDLMETAHNFQVSQEIILVLYSSFTLVYTSLIFLTQQKLRIAVELSQSCAVLQCREELCVPFSLRKKTTKILIT